MTSKKKTLANAGVMETATRNNFGETLSPQAEAERKLNLELDIIGQEYLEQKEISSKKDIVKKELKPKSKTEKHHEKKREFFKILGLKPNALRFATATKKWMYFLLAMLGTLSEFFVYQSIAETAFGMSENKSYVVGLVVAVFTKFVAWAISRYVKEWFKRSNVFRRNLQKGVVFSLVILIFFNAGAMGYVNLQKIKKEEQIRHAQFLSDAIAEIEESESGEDAAELEAELAEVQKEIGAPDSTWLSFVKSLAITLISFLIIGAGAVLFAVADLYGDALRLKKTLERKKDELANNRARHINYHEIYNSLLSQRRELTRMYAQKEYLERLLSNHS